MDYLENCPNFYWVQKYIIYTGLKRENRERERMGGREIHVLRSNHYT